jgi:hypothetical protein
MNATKAARAALPVGLIALVSGGLPPASAEPAAPTPGDEPTEGLELARVTVTERTFDRTWNFLDDNEWSAEYSIDQLVARPSETGSTTIAGDAPAVAQAVGGGASAGCRTLDVSMWIGRVYPGNHRVTYYVYHQNKRWCWNQATGVVDGVGWYDYFTDVDAVWYDRGPINNQSYHYEAWRGYSKSGHKSFTQRQIENCFVYCIGVDHPWADVHAFADGAYWFNAGL